MTSPHKRIKRSTRHTSLTETAHRAAYTLRKAGFLPHPGVINPRSSCRNPRVSIVIEDNRVRINVSGQGHQEILIYGEVDCLLIQQALEKEFQSKVTIRDMSQKEIVETSECSEISTISFR